MTASTCPYCRVPFEPADELAVCSGCGTTHHADCLAENGGCTVFGCSQAPAEEPKINVSAQEAANPSLNAAYPAMQPYQLPQPTIPSPQAPYSFLNLQSVAPAIPAPWPAAGMAPPPRPAPQADGYLSQQPLPAYPIYTNVATGNVPAYTSPSTQPTFAGYAPPPYDPALYANYTPMRKSRVVYVLLAVFLGPFGGHNFYAGFTTKAIIQLCLTMLSCFFLSFVSWIWAIVEACIIDHDNDGIAFV